MAIKSTTMYSIWRSVWLHCLDYNYNAISYNFKVKVPTDFGTTYKDRYIFHSIGQQLVSFEDGIYFSLANIENGCCYIRDTNIDHYYNFMKIQDGVLYWFEQELNWMISKRLSLPKYKNPMDYFTTQDGLNLSPIVTDYRQHNISLQTMVIFQKLFKVLDKSKFNDILHKYIVHFIHQSGLLLINKEQKCKAKLLVDKYLQYL